MSTGIALGLWLDGLDYRKMMSALRGFIIWVIKVMKKTKEYSRLSFIALTNDSRTTAESFPGLRNKVKVEP